MIKTIYVTLISILINHISIAQNIIPLPQELKNEIGFFELTKATTINVNKDFAAEALRFNEQLKNIAGYQLRLNYDNNEKKANSILIKQRSSLATEAYELEVTPKRIVIEAADNKGAFYALMSLLQLLPDEALRSKKNDSVIKISAVDISDYPRFKWRGLMLDCSRTFIAPSYIKRTIQRMAFYKLNILHLHLTDDQGWRLENASYPLLSKKAAFFDKSYHEPKEFDGYYTDGDIKDLILFAKKYHIQIVPEIESPGHSHAALFAYPELSCSGKVSLIFPIGSSGPDELPGDPEEVHNEVVFDVGNPKTYIFFKKILTKVADQFPSPYVHLGGDEVRSGSWKNCPKCQQLVDSLHLANDGAALQGYFMKTIAKYVTQKGKRPVGWDEVLEDPQSISKDWIIMSWRSDGKQGIEAAHHGYDVVMTPTSNLYFDYPYKQTNTKKVFDFDPLFHQKDSMTLKHIIGIQANYWSHIYRTESKIDYQLYPRLLGLAERAWSSEDDTDYAGFSWREKRQKLWLDQMEIKYNRTDLSYDQRDK